jgi:transcriptional regulator with XRE-family HTH domain
MINESDLSYSAIAKKADVSREQLYRWKNAEVNDPSSDSLFAIADALGYTVKHHNTKNLKLMKKLNTGDNTTMDTQKDTMINNQQKLINIYESQITQLENQNKALESSQTRTVESVLYDQLKWDWITTVDVKISLTKGITRRIYDLQNIEKMAQSLDTTIDIILPYFDVTTFHKMYDHPINQIITKESLKALRHKTDTFLEIIKDGVKKGMQTLDFFLGNHYITIFIDYELNNKTCKTITHCKMIKKGMNTLTIQNKIQLLHT